MITINRIDHLVLTVKDIGVTVDFYTHVLGMEKVLFGEDRIALSCGAQKINLHELGNEFEPKAENVKEGSADLCLIIDQSLPQAMSHLKACGVDLLEGPVERTGAKGKIMSLYIRDPDENLIEISHYCE